MDDIDITDTAFSLAFNNATTNTPITDNTIFIYIGASILIIFIFMFAYKFYTDKPAKQIQMDCQGGFCTMNDKHLI
jgi:hypothetical protein